MTNLSYSESKSIQTICHIINIFSNIKRINFIKHDNISTIFQINKQTYWLPTHFKKNVGISRSFWL